MSTTPTWFIWITIAIGLISFWLLNYATRLRLEKLPQLEIIFDKNDPRCFHETFLEKDRENKALYVAVLPRSISATPIKGCVGWLNAISELGDDGQWHQTTFVNRQPLEWGAIGFGRADIDNVTSQSLNVFFVKKRDPRIHPTVPRMLNKDKAIFHVRDNKVRRFDIVVVGDGTAADISLSIQLGDDWNDVRVKKI